MERLDFRIMLLSMLGSCFMQSYSQKAWTPHPPLNIPLEATGTFCEIRSNHFHSGIDYRTQQKEGLPVFAIEEGVLSRIYIQPGGYGKMLAIEHPNGYTSLYAHLRDFSPEYERIADSLRIELKQNKIDVSVQHLNIKIQRGQRIGYSGNTGSSTGPHLHFEIRETSTQHALDPFDFGLSPPDNQAPVFEQFGYYSAFKSKSGGLRIGNLQSLPPGNFPTTLLVDTGLIGFAAIVFDRQKTGGFKNGLRKLELWEESSLIFRVEFDRLDFSQTRYINAHIDYPASLSGKKWRRYFKLPNDLLANYKVGNQLMGFIHLKDGESRVLRLMAFDQAGQQASIRVTVKGSAGPVKGLAGPNVLAGKSDSLISCGASIVLTAKSLYQDEYFSKECLSENGPGGFPVYTLGSPLVPVHDYVNVYLPVPAGVSELKNYLCVAVNYKGKFVYCDSEANENYIKARSNDLGKFTLIIDSLAPVLSFSSFTGVYRPSQKIRMNLKDDFSGIKSWEVRVNGQFIPADLSLSGELVFAVPRLNYGSYALCIMATDKRGNAMSWERSILISAE
jgi:hypothetical protein